jgi:DivIVA domain-containing protein
MSDEQTEGSGAAPANAATDATDATTRRRITPIDVQQQVFRRAMLRGYHEQEVDDFLDEVTEEITALLEEHRLLVEQLHTGITQQVVGSEDIAEAKRMADDIVRRAQEEAAGILRKARTEAAASPGGGISSLQPFLAQERLFLQDLSKLIQGHADTVRDMARARRRPLPPAATPEAAPPAPPAEAGATAGATPVPGVPSEEPVSPPESVLEVPEPQDTSMKELSSSED